MINKEIIINDLKELGISCAFEKTEINECVVDTYIFKYMINKEILVGAITDGRTTEGRNISISLVLTNKKKEDARYVSNKVDELNLKCECGKFYVDDTMDIAYSVSISINDDGDTNEDVLRIYLRSTLTNVLDVMESL